MSKAEPFTLEENKALAPLLGTLVAEADAILERFDLDRIKATGERMHSAEQTQMAVGPMFNPASGLEKADMMKARGNTFRKVIELCEARQEQQAAEVKAQKSMKSNADLSSLF